MSNNVWIELEKPRDDAHAAEICEKANNMLQRLMKEEDRKLCDKFGWDKERKQYRYGSGMAYRGLTDRGEWFNLDYLGRPFPVVRYNYLVVIGRLHGDDDDHPRVYQDMTVAEARHKFTNDLRRDAGIEEADVVKEWEFTNVYIQSVATSDSTINIQE